MTCSGPGEAPSLGQEPVLDRSGNGQGEDDAFMQDMYKRMREYANSFDNLPEADFDMQLMQIGDESESSASKSDPPKGEAKSTGETLDSVTAAMRERMMVFARNFNDLDDLGPADYNFSRSFSIAIDMFDDPIPRRSNGPSLVIEDEEEEDHLRSDDSAGMNMARLGVCCM